MIMEKKTKFLIEYQEETCKKSVFQALRVDKISLKSFKYIVT